MPRYIVKFGEDQYLEWSTVVDAPTTYMTTRQDAIETWGADRIERADKNGTSAIEPPYTLEQLVGGYNRAGEGETRLTIPEIIEKYTLKEETP